MKLPLNTSYILRTITIIAFITLSVTNKAVSQPIIFEPVKQDSVLLASLVSKFEKSYKQRTATFPSENKKDFEEIYKMRWENIKEKFDEREVYTSASAQKYLDAVVAEIVKSNPSLQGNDFSCFFSRSGVPNAVYIGEGVILFNMGLFHRLNNESQLAFVLCHEISHFVLKHSENHLNKYVYTINSDEVQKELRSIKRKQYNKREQLEKLVKGVTFDSRRHSRDHEGQADSMALVFLHNTRFDISEALTTLALLDSIDVTTFKMDSVLVNTFNTTTYPFKKKWLNKEEGLLGGHAVIKEDDKMEDSLKTHPECKTRIKTLEPTVKKLRVSVAKNIIDKTKFNQLQNTFRYEIIEYAYEVNNYTRSLYYSLEMLKSRKGDPYLIAQVGKIMNACYLDQKEHKLGKHIDLPTPNYRPNYNLLLQFMQNLYLEDYASLSYHFLNQYHPALNYYAPFKDEYEISVQIAKD